MTLRAAAPAFALTAVVLWAPAGHAIELSFEAPRAGETVRDLAGIVERDDQLFIRSVARKAFDNNHVPIVAITIESMAKHGGAGMSADAFSRVLFNQWGLGASRVGKADWNKGMLLWVSVGDRTARIEVGRGWPLETQQLAQRIINEQVILRFQDGDFSGGVLAGVQGIDVLARGEELPKAPRPMWHFLLPAFLFALALGTVLSVTLQGPTGYAWFFWSQVLGLLGLILYTLLDEPRRHGYHHRRIRSGESVDGDLHDDTPRRRLTNTGADSSGGGATGAW